MLRLFMEISWLDWACTLAFELTCAAVGKC